MSPEDTFEFRLSTWNHPKNHDKLDYMVFLSKKVLKIVIFKAPLLNI